MNKLTTFVTAIASAFNTSYDSLMRYPSAVRGQAKVTHEIYKSFGHIQLTAKLTCSIIMGKRVMVVVKSFT